MEFTHYDLKFLKKGEVVEITLSGNAANVLLMDTLNYQKYRSNQACKYYGGQATTSIIKLPVPNNGNWHVVIDLGSSIGSVKSSVRVIN